MWIYRTMGITGPKIWSCDWVAEDSHQPGDWRCLDLTHTIGGLWYQFNFFVNRYIQQVSQIFTLLCKKIWPNSKLVLVCEPAAPGLVGAANTQPSSVFSVQCTMLLYIACGAATWIGHGLPRNGRTKIVFKHLWQVFWEWEANLRLDSRWKRYQTANCQHQFRH